MKKGEKQKGRKFFGGVKMNYYRNNTSSNKSNGCGKENVIEMNSPPMPPPLPPSKNKLKN